MFHPSPTITHVPISGSDICVVVDGLLAEPEQMVAYAEAQLESFRDDANNFYPGPELQLGEAFSQQLEQFFALHVRRALHGRRTLGATARLSLATRRPDQLKPLQRICHRDVTGLPPDEGAVAMVAYLFHDARMGGTSFYMPRRSPEEIAAVLNEGRMMDNRSFSRLIRTEPSYMVESNHFFEKVCEVPAAWNRAVFYSATVFHSGQIGAPELLQPDPRRGRLTMNGFFRTRLVADQV